ncbi:MAG: Hg(II)-responsive transcriptional regulator [Rhizobiaceae bacterium]|nr:MAG: Hg(II)-responsive transcriptional regulator [Rhizobiaceae bacterium]
MTKSDNSMTIGSFAEAAAVNVETIRFYQRRGLLRKPDRLHGSIRRYERRDVERVCFIKSAKELGFNLDDVSYLLKLDDGMHCKDAAELAEQRLADVRAKLAGLRRMELELSKLVGACRNEQGDVSCPLIDALHEVRRE